MLNGTHLNNVSWLHIFTFAQFARAHNVNKSLNLLTQAQIANFGHMTDGSLKFGILSVISQW